LNDQDLYYDVSSQIASEIGPVFLCITTFAVDVRRGTKGLSGRLGEAVGETRPLLVVVSW
jgi:hypothetical protein